MDPFEAEMHAAALRASSNYRVLRKLERRAFYPWEVPTHAKVGVLVDVETTGLDAQSDEVIELGMLRFAYSDSGTIFGPLETYQSFRQPHKAIPAHVTRLTGITSELVQNQRIDEQEVAKFIENADLIIAHNAGFDRLFCEKLCSTFAHKAWACSMTQVPWDREGIEGKRLFYLAYQQSYWYEGHRALDDCYAILELLEMPLPRSHEITMARLLDAARRETMKIWAIGAPYDIKDQLRERGYRWSAGNNGIYRAWHIEVAREQVDEELRFLDDLDQPEIEPLITEIDALIRFSDRLF